MSLLSRYGRPYVVFNPLKKQHRIWYYDFVKHATWGRCPFRFVVTDDQGDLITMIQRSLIKYYVKNEFDKKEV